MQIQLKLNTEIKPSDLSVQDYVLKLQQFLKSFGYDIGSFGIDGKYGTDTKNALAEFSASGKIKNPALSKDDFIRYFDEMDLRLKFKDQISFNLADKNGQVEKLQNFLKNLGYDIGASGTDKIFGRDTQNALLNFESSGKIPNPAFNFTALLQLLQDDSENNRPFADHVVSIAISEWENWGKQDISGYEKNTEGKYKKDGNGDKIPIFARLGHREADEGFYQIVGEYWKTGVSDPHRDGRSSAAWSASFISYVMKKAGAGTKFLYNEQHSVYIYKAIQAEKNKDNKYGFWAYKLNEYAPQIGDLVCYVRGDGHIDPFTSADYESHTDIVVDKETGSLKVIGGNVENSVSMKHIKTNEKGFLIDDQKEWFAVLQNRVKLNAPDVPVNPVRFFSNAPVGVTQLPVNAFRLTDEWLQKIIEVTGKFESGRGFSAVTGNFDAMGISCGLLQWNIGKESLQPLIRKAGQALLTEHLGDSLGYELWQACQMTTSLQDGLNIVRSWQVGDKIKADIQAKLQRLFGSTEMVQIQKDEIRKMAANTVSNYVIPWENLTTHADHVILRDFIWFFDLVTLNGGYKGHLGTITPNDAVNFIKDKSLKQIYDEIESWVESYPNHMKDENGKDVSTYFLKEATDNIDLWRNKITDKNVALFVLGYLRAKMSKPIFQLVTFSRRGTIALGTGHVNRELFTFNFGNE